MKRIFILSVLIFLVSVSYGQFSNAGTPITLTTSGSSGVATFSNNTLNIPNYTAGSGIGLNSLSALWPVLYNNGTGVFSLDTSANGMLSQWALWNDTTLLKLETYHHSAVTYAPLSSPTFTGTITTPLTAGTVRSSSGGVLSVTASDSVGSSAALFGKVDKASIKQLFHAGLVDSIKTSDTVEVGWFSSSQVIDTIRYSGQGTQSI
ncbi:MAG TPA: hypothetical protein VKI62_09180, partial [Bacteroidota bacterium]|nr:hypothetical protein [Bacteroidota bacterium]